MAANRSQYALIKQIAGILLDSDAVIFGGYVRDTVVRDVFTKMFREHSSISACNDADFLKMFDNVLMLPLYGARLIEPRNINCVMTCTQMCMFEQLLVANNLAIQYVSNSVGGERYGIDEVSDVLVREYRIGFALNPLIVTMHPELSDFGIKVDVVYSMSKSKEDLIPVNDILDCECNGLIIDKSREIKLCAVLRTADPLENLTKLTNIIKQIINKEAHLVNFSFMRERIEIMLDKGYTIHNMFNLTFVKNDAHMLQEAEIDKAGICVICLDQVGKNKSMCSKYVVKRSCCNGTVYHLHCLDDMINSPHFNGQCPTCRAPFSDVDAKKRKSAA